MKPATTIGVALFALVAVAHLLRVVLGLEVAVGGWAVPTWISYFGILVPGALAWFIVQEHKGG